MPENDQYPQHRRGRFTGVALLILIFAAGSLAIVLLQSRSASTSVGDAAPPDRAATGATSANPNILVPPGSGSRSPTPP